jgi:predicted metal-dependent enzyme (double-stranded beta helix superfamily)
MKNQEQSHFNERADNAASALKRDLSRNVNPHTGRQAELPERKVTVGPDGQPPKPLPPEGSYMRQAIEQQRRAQGQPSPQQVLGDQPQAGTPDQMLDGSVAPPLTSAQPQAQPEQQLSPNAQRRIQELTAQLRDLDRERQAALAEAKNKDETVAQMRQRMEALEAQYNGMLQANLDHLDPEIRLQVMQDTRLNEAMDKFEKRMMGQLMPHLQSLQQKSIYQEMLALGETYPAFDVQIHGPLVDMFRGKNPNCTVDQAWRAIAEPEELVTRQQARVSAVPPITPPSNGSSQPRYMPEPTSDPEAELVDEARRARDLMRSANPADHKAGLRAFDENIAKRLGGNLPGRR